MMECGEDVVEGAKAVKKYLNIANVIIGIEANKPKAIEKMTALISGLEGFKVVTLPSVYPQGAEKILIETTTGREVPQGKLPADIGVLVMNVASAGFVARYLKTGMPLITKRITVDGDAIAEPKNIEVAIGTLVKDVVDFCGGFSQEPGKVIYGGPMMGTALADIDRPILKQNNAVLAFGRQSALMPEASAWQMYQRLPDGPCTCRNRARALCQRRRRAQGSLYRPLYGMRLMFIRMPGKAPCCSDNERSKRFLEKGGKVI